MKKNLFVGVIILILCTSCVTKQKFLLAENGRLDALNRIDFLTESLEKCSDENVNQAMKISSLITDTAELRR